LHNFLADDLAASGGTWCTVRTPQGTRLRVWVDLTDHLSRVWYLFGYSAYEPGTTRLVSRLLETKSYVIDVGANIGYYTFLAAALVQDRGEVHAFEPNPSTFALLRRSAEANSFRALFLRNVAVSDSDGQAELFFPDDPFDRISPSLLHTNFVPRAHVSVDTVRLDTYCAQNHVPRVDLLRVDAEGVEAQVIVGLGSLLDRWAPDIICEVIRTHDTRLTDFLGGKGYRSFLITPAGLREADLARPTGDIELRDYYFSREPILLPAR
jgi:FkbM family methyltransferase